MPTVEQGFASLARVEVPDVWEDALERQPRRGPEGPSLARRIAIASVALAVFGGAFAYATASFVERSTPGASTTSPRPTQTAASAPRWLGEEASAMAAANGDARPASAEWVLTDANTAAPAVGLASGDPSVREYLVVMRGHFTANDAKVPPGAALPTGTVMAFTADRRSREINDWGVSDVVPSIPGLRPLELPAPSSPSPAPRAGNASIRPVLTLPGTAISIAPGDGDTVYVSVATSAGPRAVVRWDPATGRVLTSGLIPGADVLVSGDDVWASGGGGGSGATWRPASWRAALYRLDPNTLGIAQTVTLPSVPGAAAVAPDGAIWVGVRGRILVLDPQTGAVEARIATEGTARLLSFDAPTDRAYVVTDAPIAGNPERMTEIDVSTRRPVATIGVGRLTVAGIDSIAATPEGVWTTAAGGMMGGPTFYADGTLRRTEYGPEVHHGGPVVGTNAIGVSVAAGIVWLSDPGGGTVQCVDPATKRLLDEFEMPAHDESLHGRFVTSTPAGLLMDGSTYLLRLDPPAACG